MAPFIGGPNSLRIEQATLAHQKAIADLQTAVGRHNDFFLHGIVPEHLRDDSPPKRNAVDGAPD